MKQITDAKATLSTSDRVIDWYSVGPSNFSSSVCLHLIRFALILSPFLGDSEKSIVSIDHRFFAEAGGVDNIFGVINPSSHFVKDLMVLEFCIHIFYSIHLVISTDITNMSTFTN